MTLCLKSLRVGAIAAVVVSLWSGAANAKPPESDPPRTSWGAPDLQGVWDFRTITPMQRSEDLADQEFLTEEEAANLDQEAVARDVRLWERPARQTEAGGNVGAYNNFWMDRGTRTIGTRRTSLIIDPPNGRYPPMTPEGQRRADARRDDLRDNPSAWTTSFSSGVRCVLGFNAGPPMNPSAYNNNMQLFQTEDYVVLMTEMVNTSRVVRLDGSPHIDSDIRQWSGDSRGHWEGDTIAKRSRRHTSLESDVGD